MPPPQHVCNGLACPLTVRTSPCWRGTDIGTTENIIASAARPMRRQISSTKRVEFLLRRSCGLTIYAAVEFYDAFSVAFYF